MHRLPVFFALLAIATLSIFSLSEAQEAHHHDATEKKAQLTIVPLVKLNPGETKEMLFSTWCTVGATRGGGFSLAEMVDGRPSFENSKLRGNRTFTKNGVTITVPDFQGTSEFAKSAEFTSLRERDIDAFMVTITASTDATPGVFDMHLVDATCSGDCKTDFRVLVVQSAD
ncbi:MAG: hypothetical protein AAFX06_20760 [Planctomycetota bacterium]